MQFIFLTCLSVAMATHAVWACTPEEDNFPYAERFCSSNVVFRGTQTAGSSAIGPAEDDSGRDAAYISYTFRISQWFKDSTQLHEQSIRVSRTAFPGEPCYDDTVSSDSLIFATVAENLILASTCSFAVSWECVPESVRNSLAQTQC